MAEILVAHQDEVLRQHGVEGGVVVGGGQGLAGQPFGDGLQLAVAGLGPIGEGLEHQGAVVGLERVIEDEGVILRRRLGHVPALWLARQRQQALQPCQRRRAGDPDEGRAQRPHREGDDLGVRDRERAGVKLRCARGRAEDHPHLVTTHGPALGQLAQRTLEARAGQHRMAGVHLALDRVVDQPADCRARAHVHRAGGIPEQNFLRFEHPSSPDQSVSSGAPTRQLLNPSARRCAPHAPRLSSLMQAQSPSPISASSPPRMSPSS